MLTIIFNPNMTPKLFLVLVSSVLKMCPNIQISFFFISFISEPHLTVQLKCHFARLKSKVVLQLDLRDSHKPQFLVNSPKQVLSSSSVVIFEVVPLQGRRCWFIKPLRKSDQLYVPVLKDFWFSSGKIYRYAVGNGSSPLLM